MPFPIERRARLVERLRDIAETDATKLILSTLIILSVMPRLEAYAPVFFVVFALELTLRAVILRDKLRSGDFDRTELVLLIFDFFAILSFLPLESLFKVRFLRLVRLSRMLMLLGYWKPVAREIWIILTKRERRYQLVFVASSVVILTLSAAILLYHLRGFGIDFNENGTLADDANPSFWNLAWWSFRQLQDPGNLLRAPSGTLVFVISFVLTMSGIFLIAFLIGIGTTVVEELVAVGRERRLGLRDHSLIANLDRHSQVLVEELVTYYAKSFRSPRLVTLGLAPSRYDFMYDERLRRVRYRHGSPGVAHDLMKVDADRARRVILLGKTDSAGSDAEVVSQILSVRECNPHCLIFAEIFDSANVHAALAAGGNAVPILTHHFLALLQAQILTSPGAERVYNELLSTRGHEIYTALFGFGALRDQPRPTRESDFDCLLRHCQKRHDVVLLGLLRHDDDSPVGFSPLLNPAAAEPSTSPDSPAPRGELAGYFGIADNFEQLKQCVLDIPTTPTPAAPAHSDSLPQVAFSPIRRELRKVLICGRNDGLVELCDQLTAFCPGVDLFVMVPRAEQRDQLLASLVAGTEASASADRHGFLSSYEALGADTLHYRVAGEPDKTGKIQLVVGDWSDDRALTNPTPKAYDLREIEALLFTYSAGETDPDARTALGLFKLLRLARDCPGTLHPDLRVVCAIRNGPKAELFERRFAGGGAAQQGPVVTIVPVERLRNAFIAQSVFVPGISMIYDELLGHRDQALCKLSVETGTESTRQITFGDLVAQLYRRHQLIVIAVELVSGPQSTRIVVTPVRQSEAYRFRAGDLRSVYAIGAPGPASGSAQPDQTT